MVVKNGDESHGGIRKKNHQLNKQKQPQLMFWGGYFTNILKQKMGSRGHQNVERFCLNGETSPGWCDAPHVRRAPNQWTDHTIPPTVRRRVDAGGWRPCKWRLPFLGGYLDVHESHYGNQPYNGRLGYLLDRTLPKRRFDIALTLFFRKGSEIGSPVPTSDLRSHDS